MISEMSYLGGVLGHIAEAEFLGHFDGGGNYCLCECMIISCKVVVVFSLANMRQMEWM